MSSIVDLAIKSSEFEFSVMGSAGPFDSKFITSNFNDLELLALFDETFGCFQQENLDLNLDIDLDLNVDISATEFSFNPSHVDDQSVEEILADIEKQTPNPFASIGNEFTQNRSPNEQSQERLEVNKSKEEKNHTNDQSRSDLKKFAVPVVYGCVFCARRFYNKGACRRHQLAHARSQLRCTCCNTRTRSLNALRRHYEYFHRAPIRQRYVLVEEP